MNIFTSQNVNEYRDIVPLRKHQALPERKQANNQVHANCKQQYIYSLLLRILLGIPPKLYLM